MDYKYGDYKYGDRRMSRYTQEDLLAAGPRVLERIAATPVTVGDIAAVLLDAKRAGMPDSADITDYVRTKAAARRLPSNLSAWTVEDWSLAMHYEYLRATLSAPQT